MSLKMCKDTSLMVRFKIVNAMQLPINSEGTCKHECSICYRSINKRALVCSSPCNKIYHQSCLETTIEQQEMSSVYETDAPIRCSYCRREINMSAYILDTELQYLKNLKAAGGYDVNDAIQTIIEADGVFPREGFSLEYFEINDCRYLKKPKQSLRAIYKQKQKHKRPQIKMNQTRHCSK